MIKHKPDSNSTRECDYKEYFNESEKSYMTEKEAQKKNRIILPPKVKSCKQCEEFNTLLDEKDKEIKKLKSKDTNPKVDLVFGLLKSLDTTSMDSFNQSLIGAIHTLLYR